MSPPLNPEQDTHITALRADLDALRARVAALEAVVPTIVAASGAPALPTAAVPAPDPLDAYLTLTHPFPTTDAPALLKEWVGSTAYRIAFDSRRDGMHHPTFLGRVLNRPNLMFLVTTHARDVFGLFSRAPVRTVDVPSEDTGFFLFSLYSHGRVPEPRRWFRKPGDPRRAVAVTLRVASSDVWFEAGAYSVVRVATGRERSFCCALSACYDQLGDTALTGSTYPDGFSVSRLVVLAFD